MASLLRRAPSIPKLRHFSTTTTPPFPTFRAAKSAILSEQNPETLVTLFTQQSSQFPTFRRYRPLYHLTTHKLQRLNRPDLISRLIETLKNPDKISGHTEGFYVRLIMMYMNSGMVDQGIKLFDEVVERKYCEVGEKAVCAVMSGCLKNGRVQEVRELFEGLFRKVGVKPGVVSCNLVLKGFVKEGKMDLAKEWIGKMEREFGVRADIETYNVLLSAFLGGERKEFDWVVKEVLRKGLEGNVSTYSYRIRRLCKDKECARAKKLLDEMVTKGLKPSAACYNTIIDGYCWTGDLESAKKVLEKMVKDGYVKPCSFSYFTLVRSMVNEGEFDSALDVCKEIIKRKWVPPFEAMKGLVNGLVKNSKVDDAKTIVSEMKKKLKGPAVESWGKVEAALPL